MEGFVLQYLTLYILTPGLRRIYGKSLAHCSDTFDGCGNAFRKMQLGRSSMLEPFHRKWQDKSQTLQDVGK